MSAANSAKRKHPTSHGPKIPKILICFAGFKGTLSNREACDAAARGIEALGWEAHSIPIGDGGRGTSLAIQSLMGGEWASFPTHGPMGTEVTARVLCLPNALSPESIFVESSEACGHHLVPAAERDPLRASSQGLGELLLAVAKKWPRTRRLFIGLGDSAISDAGMGMLAGLGFVFRDRGGHPLWANANGLRSIETVEAPKENLFKEMRITVLCDVLNPLCGPQGSARVFAPQKGATPQQVTLIEQGMEVFARVGEAFEGRRLRDEPMAGSAGGLASAFRAFLGAELVQGARFLFDWISLDHHIERADLVVTGEGRTDRQTLSGKAPFEVIHRAGRLGKKSLVVSGILGEGHESLANEPFFLGSYACGAEPSAEIALEGKVVEVLSRIKKEI